MDGKRYGPSGKFQEVSGVFEIINMCYGLGFNDVEA